MKISDLKVGARLFFGNYGTNATSIHPITWLKANKDNEFLSEFVLDLLKFDACERLNPNRDMYWYGNRNYELSNIIQFMNSYDDDWFIPMHDHDYPPGNPSTDTDGNGDYVNHLGFLHNFEEYEVESIAGRIELPTYANIFGTGSVPRFQLFNRRGFRGRPHTDLVYNKWGHDMCEDSFCSFWLSDAGNYHYSSTYVDRGGSRRDGYPSDVHGLRPKCTIKADTEVEPMPDGTGFRIVAFDIPKEKRRDSKVVTDEEFLELMGLL